ncbi:hypothetical protein EDC01DRAFT_657075 [Geopyxis carbonaria]|nr:hypothetical protein EDC01DRAFT_657075 [Geopyxis carbonaria]
MAKTTMALAFGLVNWRALEALRVTMVAVLEGQQRLGAVAGNGVLALREETRLRVQAEMEGMITAEIRDVFRRSVVRTVMPAAGTAFFF